MVTNVQSPTDRAAMTLIEVVIVVLIIGIMAAVTVPRCADTIVQYRVQTAAQRIKADLEFARRRAKTSSSGQRVQFDSLSHSYTLVGVPHLDHPSQDYSVELDGPPYDSTIFSVDFGDDEEVVFDGYGFPDSGGTVVVQAGAYQKTVTLDPDSGKATIP